MRRQWAAGGISATFGSRRFSAEGHASRIGLQVLRAGGNAVDAAVAVGFALAVTHPNAGNIGGGGFTFIINGNRIRSYSNQSCQRA